MAHFVKEAVAISVLVLHVVRNETAENPRSLVDG